MGVVVESRDAPKPESNTSHSASVNERCNVLNDRQHCTLATALREGVGVAETDDDNESLGDQEALFDGEAVSDGVGSDVDENDADTEADGDREDEADDEISGLSDSVDVADGGLNRSCTDC